MKPCAGINQSGSFTALLNAYKASPAQKKKKKLPNRKDKNKKMEGRNDNQFEEYPDEKSMFTFHVCSCGY